MSIKKLAIRFIAVFTIALVAPALVTLLWNLIQHGDRTINWGTTFMFAFLFSILLTWRKWREMKTKQGDAN
ncbi:MAG: hypothetical protein IT308_00120 [Anaerolineaceae bacterium]|nr:hypothetical protein [Anaerolineaceae bacterium]